MRSSGAANFQKAISANIYGGLQTAQNTITDMADHLAPVFKSLHLKSIFNLKLAKTMERGETLCTLPFLQHI